MSGGSAGETSGAEQHRGDAHAVTPLHGTSPYAEGGGGVTFERKVAVQYLVHLLVGDSATELGDGRQVVSVAFQQAPAHPADDLVVRAASPDELEPSLVLAIAVRRSPRLVKSDEKTRKLFRGFVRALINAPPAGPEHRLGLVVAGPQTQAKQLATLADHANAQMDAPGFFDLVLTPRKFNAGVRGRLDHAQELVRHALRSISGAEPDRALVRQRTWQLLACLAVRMPRLESPDETDWATVANSLVPTARSSDLTGALQLRDRLATLASEYSPKSARVDLKLLRRDAHLLLDPKTRRNKQGWQALQHLHDGALASVRGEIIAADGIRRVRLDRGIAVADLVAVVGAAAGVVVSGESGIGKSALALMGLIAASDADPDNFQVSCINLRHVPKLSVQFEETLGGPLSTLLGELSAPERILVVDGADGVTEGWDGAFRYLVDAARASDATVVAVTAVDSTGVVRETLTRRLRGHITEFSVDPLTDTELAKVVETFTELRRLSANPRSRALLRRLVVSDLLVRGRVSVIPLNDADAMNEVWSGLIRRQVVPDGGSPDAREMALLQLAELELMGGHRLHIVNEMEPTALAGLRRDGLLRTSSNNPFMIGPEFAHDEVRRYAVARLLLAEEDLGSRILAAGAPRWSLSAARLACQQSLAQDDAPATPLRGRFAMLQASFDTLVEAGHNVRWGDVPGEALITLASPGTVLRDAWPGLLADKGGGLRRLARLVDQRLRDASGIVDVGAVQPIIALLLEDRAPWKFGDYAAGLLRSWLRAHVAVNAALGNPLRIQLRERLVETCSAADRRLAEEQKAAAAARAARTLEEVEQERQFEENDPWLFSEIGFGGGRRRRRPEVPHEIRDETFLELLALLGPDLGSDGEAILRRVARDAPSWLAPAVDEFFAGRALAAYGHGLLAHLTEMYYLDDEAEGSDDHRYGIRGHEPRGLQEPLAAWYLGPFISLLQTDFRNGVVVLNRLLNHAALVRARVLSRHVQRGQPLQDHVVAECQNELEIAGTRRLYVGDGHVWLWYRGTGVGPYPCFSALQALERVCDQMIEVGIPLEKLVPVLLDNCKNIAMVSLVVGLLVRHLDGADELLDPYLAEPLIWRHEFNRAASESRGFAAASDGLVAPERRKWSLREVAAFMVLRANDERVAALRLLGETLVRNARLYVERRRGNEPTTAESEISEGIETELIPIRVCASTLDRDNYQAHEFHDSVHIQATPPENVAQALRESNEDLQRSQEAFRLIVRYDDRHRGNPAEAIGPEELAADIATARKLLENPLDSRVHDPSGTAALVAAAALGAHLLNGTDLPEDVLVFAANVVLGIGEDAADPRSYDVEESLFKRTANLSAARVLPLLLLPRAARLRAVIDEEDGRLALSRAVRAGVRFAEAGGNEVRLHLARGLDRVWVTPCAEHESCHHDVGWRFATETMRECVLGPWDPDAGRPSVVALKEPFADSLANTADNSILPIRLDAAIRALAPAAMANICVSTKARALLAVLLTAQRRSLLCRERPAPDPRGTRTLEGARALLTLARDGADADIFQHIDAYADNAGLLGNLLRGLSAAAEEAPERAATARRVWPKVIRHVLELNDSGHSPFQRRHYGDMALAALIPNTAQEMSYFFRENQDKPIVWWSPLALRSEVEMWLNPAAGKATCVDQLILFLGVLSPEEQVRKNRSAQGLRG